jgi:hypothetical protein
VIAPRPNADIPHDAMHSYSHGAPAAASRIAAPFDPSDLAAKILWSVPETAFMCRVGVRSVWRMIADPRSGFPRPRRLRGRTLLVRDEVLAFLAQEARR